MIAAAENGFEHPAPPSCHRGRLNPIKLKQTLLRGSAAAALIGTLFLAHDRLNLPGAFAASKTTAHTAPKIQLDHSPLPKETRGMTSFAPVVKKVAPSVVTIYSTKTVTRSFRGNPSLDDPMFRRFFGGPEDEGVTPPGTPRRRGGRQALPRQQTEESLGSGVIVSADGYILSNSHVVDGADEVKVALPGSDERFTAKVIGADPHTDVSVLKIEARDLKPVTITDSDALQVGDVVLAVGNPFGVGQTVTMGIVSATGRGGFGIVDYEDFIQTDASINPGNSGGALVDAEGRLVGINTAIIGPTGGNIGIGFAVPINMARRVMDTLIEHGRVTRGYLGVYIQDVTPALAKQFRLKDREGALVGDVPKNTPAAEAGLLAGDVVIELNGKKTSDSRQLRLWISQTAPKTKVSLKLMRDGKERTMNVTLGELPGEPTTATSGGREQPPKPENSSEALDGVTVGDVDARTRRQHDIPGDVRGAVVTAVNGGSRAATAGLRAGDVILEINHQKVKDAQESIDISEKLRSDEQILLRVWSGSRGGGTRFIVVEPGKKSGNGK